ncbi:uncharacterized protein [Apostichopus japonicus]|uniref:uncharacterized protein n=1 Tax=Stichopus japonicus TaxID=307972 RepID=UPI003AB8204D
MANLSRTLLNLLLFLLSLRTTFGCLCPPHDNVKDQFCQKDIVFQGTVTSVVDLFLSSETPHDDVIMYHIRVDKMYRGFLGRDVWLSTSRYSSSCGVHLQEGVHYLLTTSWDKSLHSCGWNVPMSSLTEDELYAIHRNLDCLEKS